MNVLSYGFSEKRPRLPFTSLLISSISNRSIYSSSRLLCLTNCKLLTTSSTSCSLSNSASSSTSTLSPSSLDIECVEEPLISFGAVQSNLSYWLFGLNGCFYYGRNTLLPDWWSGSYGSYCPSKQKRTTHLESGVWLSIVLYHTKDDEYLWRSTLSDEMYANPRKPFEYTEEWEEGNHWSDSLWKT